LHLYVLSQVEKPAGGWEGEGRSLLKGTVARDFWPLVFS
jgi:hypothetical protein